MYPSSLSLWTERMDSPTYVVKASWCQSLREVRREEETRQEGKKQVVTVTAHSFRVSTIPTETQQELHTKQKETFS